MHSSPRLNRRKIVVGMALAPLVSLPVCAGQAPMRFKRALLGTMVDVVVADTADNARASIQVEQAFGEMRRLERLMSRFDPASELSRINAQAGGDAAPVGPELMAVLRDAKERAALTGGAFDPVLGQLTVQADPGAQRLDDAFVRQMLHSANSAALELDERRMRVRLNHPSARLDLGGVAKLPILAAGLRRLEDSGISGVLINGGGDVVASARPDGQAWRIGIRDADQPDHLIAELPLRTGVIASSGDYERFVTLDGQRVHHIIDPASGRSTRGLRGVTLVADRIDVVNGLGPAAMVAGPVQAMRRLKQWGVLEALLMSSDASVEVSETLRVRLKAPPGQTRMRAMLG